MDGVFRGLAELLRGISLSWFEYHRISYTSRLRALENRVSLFQVVDMIFTYNFLVKFS